MQRLSPDTQLSREALSGLIRQTVTETLAGLGFHSETPAELQADMYYLRRIRRGSEEMGRRLRNAVLTTLASTSLWLLWEAVRTQMGK